MFLILFVSVFLSACSEEPPQAEETNTKQAVDAKVSSDNNVNKTMKKEVVPEPEKAAEVVSHPPEAKATAEPVTIEGLKSEILQEGTGQVAQKGDNVVVHYTGTFPDGKKFDSSLDRGDPFNFTLGAGQVIKGWDEGVAGMKIGEKRKLTVSPEMGYGARAVGPIPPNSILVFEVELLEIKGMKEAVEGGVKE